MEDKPNRKLLPHHTHCTSFKKVKHQDSSAENDFYAQWWDLCYANPTLSFDRSHIYVSHFPEAFHIDAFLHR